MKIYRLPELADQNPDGDFLLGSGELGTDAISVLYGRISRGGAPRKVSAGDGHNAVLIVVAGEMSVVLKNRTFTVSAGEAFRVDGPDEACLENTGERESIYILTAGRSDSGPPGVDNASVPSSVKSPAPCNKPDPEGAGEPEGPGEMELPDIDAAGVSFAGTDESGLDETEFEITRDDTPSPDAGEEER